MSRRTFEAAMPFREHRGFLLIVLKMAVVVDIAWFRNSVLEVDVVNDLSNCDIAWFRIGFDESLM